MSPIAVLRRTVLVLALAGPAWGQTPPPAALAPAPAAAPATAATPNAADPTQNEIDIIAHLPGPALWRVSTPHSELWIVGLAGPIPKRLVWDKRRIEAALDGAEELVIPPGASINLLDIAGLLLDPFHRYHYPGGKTLRGAMNADMRARFEAAAKAVGQDPAHYDHWRPLVTAIALLSDAQKHDAVNPQGPQETLMTLAKARKVRVRRLANYSLGELLRAFNNAAPDAPDVCLSLVVDLIPHLPAYSAQIGQVWARGDVDAVRAAEANITSDRCFTAVPGIVRLQDKMTQDWAKDLAATLSRPGKTVMAVDMESLTRPGGLLDQLRAEGLDVTGRAY